MKGSEKRKRNGDGKKKCWRKREKRKKIKLGKEKCMYGEIDNGD